MAIGALSAPFVFLLMLSEYRLSRVHANEYAAKRYLFEQRKKSIEILVLGSSHAFYGVMPNVLGKPAFNLAGPSQTFFYDRALLEKYLDQMPSLQTVILSVSYFSFERELDEGIERWRSYYYRYEWGLPQRDWHMAAHLRNYSGYYLCKPEIGVQKILFGPLKDVTSNFDQWGGVTNRLMFAGDNARGVDGTEDAGGLTNRIVTVDGLNNSLVTAHLQQSALVQLSWHQSRMNPADIPENVRLLNDCVQQLQRRRIRPVLVTPPVSRYYAEQMNAAAYQRMQNLVRQIALINKVEYLNYTFDRRFSDRDFMDASHLNLAGAEKFSLILRDEAVSPESVRLSAQ
jgi:hypothetical protein